jgi:tetratricopeptide (TPR) repeat protein
MARAAVKAKQAQRAGAQPARAAAARSGRRRRASGGNPNQQLFFMRLRRKAKVAYLVLAVLFALTFAFVGVGSGSNSGLDQLFSGLNIFHHSGTSVSKAQKEIAKHPNDAKGYRDLVAAFEKKGDTAGAIGALQQYTGVRPKAVWAWQQLGQLQLTQGQDYYNQYYAAYQNRLFAAPGESFLPSGKLATGIGVNRVEQAAANEAETSLQDLQSRMQLAFGNAVSSYKQVTKLRPKDANAEFQLAQAAQTANDTTTAIAAYKAYLKLNPGSASAGQIRKLIKQLGGK